MNCNNSRCCNFLAHDTIINVHNQVPHFHNFTINNQAQERTFLPLYQGESQQTINQYNPYYSPPTSTSPEKTLKMMQEQSFLDLIYNNEFYNDGVDNQLFPVSPNSFQSFDSFEDMFHHQTNANTPHQELFPRVNMNKYTSPPTYKATRRRTHPSQLKCMICFKTFSRPYNLKSHHRTHTKERPFKCLHPECGWNFARPHDLKRHELLHSGIKPHVCSCGKKFSRSDAFKRHRQADPTCTTVKTADTRKRGRRS